ncbi:uncharacterized protein LOC130731241 [Lotus japonicus]|uniref:uncharacterized protein LOC130731241 n=1 Tax=Lotus japonicus TaxID=34305 RepID=UPI00258B15D3|nr:uncharacterized protein LOC130731241 [Lotus japonicus]
MGQVKRDNKIAQLPTSQQHRLSLTTTKSNTTSISISPIVKYSKLKKLFSAKNLTTTTTAPPSSCGRTQRVTKVLNCGRGSGCASSCVVELQTNTNGYGRNCCRDAGARLPHSSRSGPQFKSLQVTTVSGADMSRNRNQRRGWISNENVIPISIENMDPPLPVIKGVRKSDEGNSFWKRRSGGVALKSLKLPQIHHPRHHLQLTSV